MASGVVQEELTKMEALTQNMATVSSLQSSKPQEMEAVPSDAVATAASSQSEARQSEPDKVETSPTDSIAKVASIQSVSTDDTARKKVNAPSTAFHIPALVGRPNGGKHTLRTRPVLMSCDPQERKRFTLTIYAMLSTQVAAVALITAVVTAGIVSPSWWPKKFGGWLPNEIAPITSTTPDWMPSYPINVLIALFPALLCMVLVFVALSLSRYNQQTRRFLFAACTLITGISLGLLTYVESSFPTTFICVLLMSLVIHTFSIGVNLISCLASAFGQVKPKASKMEMMGQTSCLSGYEKLICLMYDEEAAYTRASLVCAGMSWIAGTVTSAVVVAIFDLDWLPWSFAAPMACPFVLYFTYGVEKQVRRCKPQEKEDAMVNLSIDLFFFMAEGFTIDTSILKTTELGSARPKPVARGSFRYTMRQVSSKTTRSTTMSSTPSKPWKPVYTVTAPMDTVAV